MLYRGRFRSSNLIFWRRAWCTACCLDFKVGLTPNESNYSIYVGVKVVISQWPRDIIEDSRESIQKLCKRKAASLINVVRQNFTSNSFLKIYHFATSNPKACSILIWSWDKKKLNASFSESCLFFPLYGIMRLLVKTQALLPTTKQPSGKSWTRL